MKNKKFNKIWRLLLILTIAYSVGILIIYIFQDKNMYIVLIGEIFVVMGIALPLSKTLWFKFGNHKSIMEVTKDETTDSYDLKTILGRSLFTDKHYISAFMHKNTPRYVKKEELEALLEDDGNKKISSYTELLKIMENELKK